MSSRLRVWDWIGVTAVGCATTPAPATPRAVSWDPSLSAFAPLAPNPSSDQAVLERQLAATWEDVLELRHKDERAEVTSCRTLLTLGDAYEPVRAAEFPIYRDRRVECRAIQMVVDARPSRFSTWDAFTLDSHAPERLPAAFSLAVSPDDEQRVAEFAARHEAWSKVEPVEFVASTAPNTAKYRAGPAEQVITLLARGDFNGDGVEDLLLMSHAHLTEGTYTRTRSFLITLHQPSQPVADLISVQ
ncbi:MAG TPA: hypothetical protein VG963_14795 [Polyangiaceae bacterium]|nr:hypothetical protein [Polyangiaceae bacterium]